MSTIFYENHRICAESAIVMTIVWLQPFIQPFVVHDFFYFPQKMILRYKCVQIYNDCFPPCIFSPLFHKNTPICEYYITNEGIGSFFDRSQRFYIDFTYLRCRI